jgi:hypothetical protein
VTANEGAEFTSLELAPFPFDGYSSQFDSYKYRSGEPLDENLVPCGLSFRHSAYGVEGIKCNREKP